MQDTPPGTGRETLAILLKDAVYVSLLAGATICQCDVPWFHWFRG